MKAPRFLFVVPASVAALLFAVGPAPIAAAPAKKTLNRSFLESTEESRHHVACNASTNDSVLAAIGGPREAVLRTAPPFIGDLTDSIMAGVLGETTDSTDTTRSEDNDPITDTSIGGTPDWMGEPLGAGTPLAFVVDTVMEIEGITSFSASPAPLVRTAEVGRPTVATVDQNPGFDRAGRGDFEDGPRWTEYEANPPLPPNRFFSRFFPVLAYVAHTARMDIFRNLLRARDRRGDRRRHPCCHRRPRVPSVSTRRRHPSRFSRAMSCVWSIVGKLARSLRFDKATTGTSVATSAAPSPPEPAEPRESLEAPWPPMSGTAAPSPADPLTLTIPLDAPAAPWPPLCPFPPSAPGGMSIPLEPPFAAFPPPPAAALLPPASHAAVMGPVDAAVWSGLGKAFAVSDLDEPDGKEPMRGWASLIDADLDRLSVRCAEERETVRWILTQSVELYPNTGYNQGSDAAALALSRAMGGDREAVLRVYVKWVCPTVRFQSSTEGGVFKKLHKGMTHTWRVLRRCSPSVFTWLHSDANASLMLNDIDGEEALIFAYGSVFMGPVSSLCTRQGFPSNVVDDIIEKTLEAGDSGPAVCLWVTLCLLALAETEASRMNDMDKNVCIARRLRAAGQAVHTFDDLEAAAPQDLVQFVSGYERAISC